MVGILWWPSNLTGPGAAPDALLWNVPLWRRLARQLRSAGVSRLVLAGPVSDLTRRRELEPAIEEAGAVSGRALVVASDWVIDPRLISLLARRTSPAVVTAGGRFAGAALLGERELARLDASRGIEVVAEELLTLGLETIPVEGLPDYRLDMRRRVPVYVRRMRSDEDAQEAEARLLDATQKGTNDLPAQYVHPPLENALVRLLVPLRVSANAVTGAVAAAGLLAAWCFFTGRLATGILLAMTVGVLDGVDGKIARVTLTATNFGNWLDHVTDNVYEISWYLSLGAYLSRLSRMSGTAGAESYFRAAWVMCGIYLLDRLVLGVWKLYREGDFHESSSWDRAFRRVCGRRNNIVYLLAIFIALGRPAAGFLAALFWWGVTLVVHAVRVCRALSLGIGERKAAAL